MDSGATSPAGGRPLVELFSVRALSLGGGGGTPPCGKVTVFDGRRGQIVYSRSRDEPHHSYSHAQQDELVLTGPHRAIPGDGTSVIELDLHHSNQEPAPPPYMRVQEKEEEEEANLGLIHWDIHNPSQEHDKPISRTVDTRYGPVEVSYAVLSNAVEAEVVAKLKLLRPPMVEEDVDGDGGKGRPAAAACVRVRGRIVARSQLLGVGPILFDGEFGGESSSAGESPSPGATTTTTIPLARSVVAVPLGWPLTVEADLRDDSGGEIVRGSLEFHPELDGQPVERLVSRNGAMEVQITWWSID